MNKSVKFYALAAMVLGASFMSVNCVNNDAKAQVKNENLSAVESGMMLDGAFFSSGNVVDWVCYGEGESGVFYLIYDDADAALDYEAVSVDSVTYNAVIEAREAGTELAGMFRAFDDEPDCYAVVPHPDF